jgi:hypothetical protein
MLWRWCRRRHPNKNRKWIKKKYFRQEGHRHWVFTGLLRDHKGKEWPIQCVLAGGVQNCPPDTGPGGRPIGDRVANRSARGEYGSPAG